MNPVTDENLDILYNALKAKHRISLSEFAKAHEQTFGWAKLLAFRLIKEGIAAFDELGDNDKMLNLKDSSFEGFVAKTKRLAELNRIEQEANERQKIVDDTTIKANLDQIKNNKITRRMAVIAIVISILTAVYTASRDIIVAKQQKQSELPSKTYDTSQCQSPN